MNKFITGKLLFVFILLLSISSCKKENNPVMPEPEQRQVLMPLSIGNIWIIKVSFLDTLGNVTSTQFDTMKVLRDTTIEGKQWYITNWDIYRNEPDGLYIWLTKPHLIYKYPANAGDTYRTGSATVKIVSTNENHSVPYGTLKCYHYQLTYDNTNGYKQNNFTSPGVGYVSWESGTNTQITHKFYTSIRYELVSYSLKK